MKVIQFLVCFVTGYTTERVVLRRGTVPSIFSWTKIIPVRKRKDKIIVRNVGNVVDIRAENSKEKEFESNYEQCLEKLVGNSVFESIFIKSEPLDDDEHTVYKQIDKQNERVKGFQGSKFIVKDTLQTIDNMVLNRDRCLINIFYIESDMRLLEHDYHVTKTTPVEPKSTKSRYDIEQFREDPTGLKFFTGLGCYEKFLEVLRALGAKIYHLEYCGNGSTGNLSVPNQLFLTLWKLQRHSPDFELCRHFNIPIMAVSNIFKTWVRFFVEERPQIEIRPGKLLFDFYHIRRFGLCYVPKPVAMEPETVNEAQAST